MSSIFTKIVSGEIPCYKVAEDDKHLAFLDINPQCEGHTLCIPKKEVDYIFDLENEALADLMLFSKKTAKALESVVRCERVAVAVVGLEVPHAHVHLMPIRTMRDFGFGKPSLGMGKDELAALAASVLAAFEAA